LLDHGLPCLPEEPLAMIRLYRAPFSTNVERVALALAHKGLEVESVVISYDDRSLVERVSGQPLVPVIDDDGTIVAGSMRIVGHLEERFPEPPLYPVAAARRAQLDGFVDWFDGVWKVAPNAIEAELGRAAPDAARIAALGAEMTAALDRFEALLDGREHLLGDAFSAADCAAFPFLKYALRRDPADDELFHRILDEHQPLGADHPRLADWIERVDARPRAS
jgi:glutathione S-transferase